MAYHVLLLSEIPQAGLKIFNDSYIVQRAWEDPDAILVRSNLVDTDKYKHLLAVARAGAGVDTITVERATERGICVFNAPGANANAVAELVFIMLGHYARRIAPAFEFIRSLADFKGTAEEMHTHIENGKSHFNGFELDEKTLGIIGLGNIGVRVANRGLEYRMHVVGYDSLPTLANMHRLDARVLIASRLEEVVSCADILSVHVPLLSTTRNLIGEKELSLVKPGVILMNYARSGIYNDDAVCSAIDKGIVRAYLTDFPTPALVQNKNVICTPHLGASTAESSEKSTLMAAECLRNYLSYGIVAHSVNFPTVEVMPRRSTKTRLAVVNRDIPKMIGKITRTLGAFGVNIQSMKNESNGTIGYNIIDLDVSISDDVVTMLKRIKNVLRVRKICF
ncbi:MAG: phosphoglycerate dehydrogenase-like oxidoreductase [Parcubacteria group bacterium Greene0714_4]|nr:MAG: phosphoglycerate dehydrogenase-like oxidoreductase [Parcubacteria group bacterium Greene0714_4]